MILSMTGYGSAHTMEDRVSYTVELRSLNNRYYKAIIKLPELLQSLEAQVDKWLRESLGRGSVVYTLRMIDESPTAAYSVNAAALRFYLEGLQELKLDGAAVSIDLAGLLNLPGVCQPPELDDIAWAGRKAVVEKLTRAAIEQLLEMRRTEGRFLRDHLLAQCAVIREHAVVVKGRAPHVIEEYQERLRIRVNRLVQTAQLELDQDTLTREVAVYADRCDISEELARLDSHLDQFVTLCDSREEAGRKLDFLAQEMLREANTIGSKSNDSTIARSVVEVKAAIDRLKEQVQNVE